MILMIDPILFWSIISSLAALIIISILGILDLYPPIAQSIIQFIHHTRHHLTESRMRKASRQFAREILRMEKQPQTHALPTTNAHREFEPAPPPITDLIIFFSEHKYYCEHCYEHEKTPGADKEKPLDLPDTQEIVTHLIQQVEAEWHKRQQQSQEN